MDPVHFPKANVVMRGGPGVRDVAALREEEKSGSGSGSVVVATCWALSEEERLRLVSGSAFVRLETWGGMPPVRLEVVRGSEMGFEVGRGVRLEGEQSEREARASGLPRVGMLLYTREARKVGNGICVVEGSRGTDGKFCVALDYGNEVWIAPEELVELWEWDERLPDSDLEQGPSFLAAWVKQRLMLLSCSQLSKGGVQEDCFSAISLAGECFASVEQGGGPRFFRKALTNVGAAFLRFFAGKDWWEEKGQPLFDQGARGPRKE